ncbi:MAG: DUF3874 domain-containing protein [Bacteroidaceae bacterium]|nr:DUF3874 domain-containing protein [Bacteroidaceae bacterium]
MQLKKLFSNYWSRFKRSFRRVLQSQTQVRESTFSRNADDITDFLQKRYTFRYNVLTDETEYRPLDSSSAMSKETPLKPFRPLLPRVLNGMCLAAREAGLPVWDRDVVRYVQSDRISGYHPFTDYLAHLPVWDGVNRISPLACRVSDLPLWVEGFHRWMLALTAQWMQVDTLHANSVAPLLVSAEQGTHKSTFCKLLMPPVLRRYYTDSFDLQAESQAERKLSEYGLINLDEFDRLLTTPRRTALLKNLMQLSGLSLRRPHQRFFRALPRVASFIGTANRRDLLNDPTGSRRFLCVEVKGVIDVSPIAYEQVFAQLKAEIQAGERYWFNKEEEHAIQRNNEAFYRVPAEQEVFLDHFRAADPDEACELLSAATLLQRMRRFNAAALRQSISLTSLGRTLARLGVERVHTKQGNRYRVVCLQPMI